MPHAPKSGASRAGPCGFGVKVHTCWLPFGPGGCGYHMPFDVSMNGAPLNDRSCATTSPHSNSADTTCQLRSYPPPPGGFLS